MQYDDRAVEVRIDRFRGFHEGFEMRYPGRGLALDGHVALPEDAHVDAAEATATLRDTGTLEVRVPKVEQAVADDMDETLETESVDETDAEESDHEVEADDAGDEDDESETGGSTAGGGDQ